MRTPIFVRPLTDAERQALSAGLRSKDAFVLRRCQILLASARGERAPRIAAQLGCDDQTVLDGLHAFNARGLDALAKRSSRAHHPRPQAFPGERAEQLRARLHRRPRDARPPHECVDAGPRRRGEFRPRPDGPPGDGRSHSADAAAPGRRLETRQALDHQSRSRVCPKKGQRDRLIAVAERRPDWVLGFADETWWSRFSRPHLHTWADATEGALRLVEQAVPKADPDPKAFACYGVLLRQAAYAERVWLRFVDGHPVSAITEQFLGWCCDQLQAVGIRVWALIWDNASWHVSKRVRAWIRAHNRRVKQQGVRILSCYLPVKSPWLNPIEPKWVHSKRAIVEPARLLSAQELADRVCAYVGCSHELHLTNPDKAA
jgi:hypothetical protein